MHALLAALAILAIGDEGEATAYRVRLIVKATNEGYRFYDHDLSAAPLDVPGEPSGGRAP